MVKHFLQMSFAGIALLWMYGCTQSSGSGKMYPMIFDTPEAVVEDAKLRVEPITMEDFKVLMDEMEPFVLIDVRTKGEHDAGYIPGSVLMPRGVLEFRIANEDVWDEEGMYVPLKEDLLIIYCKKGNRSSLGADALQRLGYTNVKVLEGGMIDWKAAYPDDVEVNIDLSGDGGAMVTASGDSGGC